VIRDSTGARRPVRSTPRPVRRLQRQTYRVPDVDQPRETIDVVYLPYLPLRDRIIVGDWELIPRATLALDDCLDERTDELAQGLADVYVLPAGAGTAAGVFVRPRDGHVGDKLDNPQLVDDLRRACVVAVLDVNPSPLKDECDPNAGHWMLTSDNALVVAHGINRELGYTGSITGGRVARLSLGVPVLEDPENPHIARATIPPPGDVRIPTFRPPTLDAEYAEATWESIRRRRATAPTSDRVARARMAQRNAAHR
jgi:hypothetical protein